MLFWRENSPLLARHSEVSIALSIHGELRVSFSSILRAGMQLNMAEYDLAWLPAWLQRHQVEASDETIKEPQTPSEQAFKVLAILQGNTSGRKDVNGMPRENGRYNSCLLFLSGEDNSPINFDPSTENVLNFHLHLSSYGDSQYSQSKLFDCNKVMTMQVVENSVGPGEKAYQSKMDYDASGVNLLTLTSVQRTVENVGPQFPSNDKGRGRQYEGKCNARCLEGADVNDAIELSIAASEALVIHELAKSESESASETMPTAAVLEVALRVKQVRLLGLEEDFHCTTEEFEEISSLSDLDDLTMTDAFEDVGLSLSGSGDQSISCSNVSQVKDTLSENDYGCRTGFQHAELVTQGKKLSGDPSLGCHTASVASHINPVLHQSAQGNAHVLATAQRVEFAMMETSVQPQVDLNSSHALITKNAEAENEVSYEVPDRFRSRWLGGWTGKEVDASSPLNQNNTKRIPKFFVSETSFLSESANDPPDENSFVLKHEMRSKLASQSSIPFEGLPDSADEDILISQDVVRSSNLSMVDPLCSVVPCSISSENVNASLAHNGNNGEVDAENCFSPTSELGRKNSCGTSDQNVGYFIQDWQAAPTVHVECSRAPFRRQLTSLKTYSKLLPKHDGILESGRLKNSQSFPSVCTRELLSLNQNVGCIRSSDKRTSKRILSLRSTSECIGSRGNEENDKNIVTGNPERNNNGHAKDGAKLQVQPSKDRTLPLILNLRTHRCLQANKLSALNNIEEKTPECLQETVVNLHQDKELQKIQSECNNPHDIQVPVTKRVHFSEVEFECQHNKDLQKLQYSHKNRSTIRASKRSKFSNRRLDSRTQDVKRCLTTCLVKDGKRLIFQGMEFLLTGFCTQKETELEGLIRKYGGIVLPDIPPPSNTRRKRSSRSNFQQLPVVLCLKKLQTSKFLYGCAVNAYILKAKWLTDSIAAVSIIPPEKYMILSNQVTVKCTKIGKSVHRDNHKHIFNGVGIMLHGKHSFCTNLAKIFKHGGGQVFKTLEWLVHSLDSERISVGAIVAEEESIASRHLRYCASERKIPMMTASWIIKSLHLGKLLPFTENNHTPLPSNEILEWSKEI